MATIPTNNPIPSEDPRDLKFNAGKIDEVVNSDAHYYTDRFGVRRWTIEGFQYTAEKAIRAYGYVTVDSFEDGATLTLPNEILRYESTGMYYRWDGALPKLVPPGSTPSSSGGVGVGAWMSVADAALRNDLSQQDGYKNLGEVQNFAALRALVPSAAGIRVKLRGWYSDSVAGGGDFIAVSGPATDDGGVIASVNASWHWKRVLNDSVWPEMFGAKNDGVTDDSASINSCMAAASTYGKRVVPYGTGTLLCGAPISIPSGVKVYGAGRLKFKRGASVSTALDFITVGSNAALNGIIVDGSRVTNQAPAEVVLIRVGNNVLIENCDISGSVGYLIVANATMGVRIRGNKLHDVGGYAVALYGDGTFLSADVIVDKNTIYDVGHGSVTIQEYVSGLIMDNNVTGTYIGGPGDRMYVATNVSGTVTRVSGPDFTGVRPGMWLVLPGGGEHRITSVNSATSITVSPAPPSNSAQVRAIVGTGDHIGVQSCSYVKVINNLIKGCVTYGTGGGTMSGVTIQCNYCEWVGNTIQNTGKNGINIGQSGASVNGCSVLNNTLILTGSGGMGTSTAYLLPEFDTAALALYQATPGGLNNTTISGNRVTTFGGDLGIGIGWLYMSGLSQGTVVANGNSQSGYADGYIRGDILEVILTGYGTGAALTTNISTGDAVRIAIQTGTSPTESPYFNVRKVIKSNTGAIVTGQIVSTTGGYYHCVGMQTSTESNWALGQLGTPSGSITYHLRG